MSKWVQFTGGDEQIAELENNKNGYIVRGENLSERIRVVFDTEGIEILPFKYWLIPDDPLREMKIRQSQTGQPVWIKMESSTYWVIAMRGFDLIYQDHVVSVIKSITPDWNIPNAEYSFTEFEKSVDK